jgi:FkbM family methyltransferase
VSFAFYLRGWRGVTVEPNPWLAQLSEAVRPRDTRIQSLVGAASGQATYYLVEDFHGLSTTVESHARAAQSEYGKRSEAKAMPVTTLQAICERHAPGEIDFLKIDVEGAERAVVEGGDWRRHRPKVVVLEALAPVTLAPSWPDWEPMLVGQGYRFAFFDGLNRYYAAGEHGELAPRLADAPVSFPGIVPFRSFKPALDDAAHPDHALARLLAGTDMVRLPLLPPEQVAERLTAGLEPAGLDRPATPQDLAGLERRLFGGAPRPGFAASLAASPNATLRDLYRSAVTTATFRTACGRISASYAW